MATGKPEQNPDYLLEQALEGVDLSKLDKGKEEEYPTISPKEIAEAYEFNPLRGKLLKLANQNLQQARAQAEGEVERVKQPREMGWSLSITAPQGLVGLWSCWLGNQFYLGYPKEVQIPDKLVTQILEVEPARPVANERFGVRQWAKFYGPQLGLARPEGRVWINHDDSYLSGVHFPAITDTDNLEEIYYGHENCKGVYTEQFSFFSEQEPEAPNATPEAIQTYRDKFIRLAAEIAFRAGGSKAVNIDYGFVLVPEDLYREGYEDIKWLKGDLGQRKGWNNEVVRGKKGDSIIFLKSGNSLVPWSTILRAPASRLTSPTMLADFIKEDLLWF